MTVLEENRSSQIYAVKAFAMLSVICAHMKLQLEYGMAGWLPDRIISIYSIVGVPIFFICSGYYYHREEGDTGEFWKKKTKNIIVPWIIWSALTNILNNLITRRTVSMKGFAGWFSGYSSLYYYNHAKMGLQDTVDLLMDCIREMAVDYATDAEMYFGQLEKHMFNMMIMKREYFVAYSKWLFIFWNPMRISWSRRDLHLREHVVLPVNIY